MNFETTVGLLIVTESRFTLIQENGIVVTAPKHVAVANECEADEVAKSMKNIAERYSEGSANEHLLQLQRRTN